MPRTIIGDIGGKPYSPATKAGNLIFVSGQLGLDSGGNVVSNDAGLQTRQCLENLVLVLKEAGATLNDVTMVNVYLSSLGSDYDAMNEVYREFFGDEPPARATVEAQLAMNLKVEISCIAVATD